MTNLKDYVYYINSSLDFGETYKAIIKNESISPSQSSSESDENLNIVFETLCDRVNEIQESGEKQFKKLYQIYSR